MKKSIIYILTVLMALSFYGCERNNKYNLDEFINALNSQGNYNLSAEQFTITKEDDNYIFSCMVDSNILISLYADEVGEIIQYCITKDRTPNENYYLLCECIFKIISDINANECTDLIKDLKNNQTCSYDGWLVTDIVTPVGDNIIINRQNSSVNTPTLPTIRGYVSEDDISRPTVTE